MNYFKKEWAEKKAAVVRIIHTAAAKYIISVLLFRAF